MEKAALRTLLHKQCKVWLKVGQGSLHGKEMTAKDSGTLKDFTTSTKVERERFINTP